MEEAPVKPPEQEGMEGSRQQLLRRAIGKIQADKQLDGAEKSKRIQVKLSCRVRKHCAEP